MKVIISISIIGMLILTSCYKPDIESTDWQYNDTINLIHFKKFQYLMQKGTEDTLKLAGVINNPMIIQGYPCDSNMIYMNMEGELLGFRLAQKRILYDLKLAKGTWIFFNEDGSYTCKFPKNTTIYGFNIHGNASDDDSKGIPTDFYKNGKLKFFYPVEDVVVNEIHCKASLAHGIELYDNGSLKKCKLSQNETIQGKHYKKNSLINFSENGEVIGAN